MHLYSSVSINILKHHSNKYRNFKIERWSNKYRNFKIEWIPSSKEKQGSIVHLNGHLAHLKHHVNARPNNE
jgi:hypothetical protein